MGFMSMLGGLFGEPEKPKKKVVTRATDKDTSGAKNRKPGNEVVRSHRTTDTLDLIPLPPQAIRDFVLWDSSYQRRLVGEILVQTGVLEEELVRRISQEQAKRKDKVRFGELAIALGFLTPEQVKDALGKQRLTVYVDERHVGSPSFLTWVSDIRSHGIDLFPKPVAAQELSRLRDSGFGGFVEKNSADAGLATLMFAKRLISSCAAMGGADMHILVREGYTDIQLRIKGELRTVTNLSSQEGDVLIRAIYTGLTSVKESMINPFEFQDAQISGETLRGTGLTSIRIIRGPCYPVEQGGQFMVARLQGRQVSGSTDVMALQRKIPFSPAGEFRLPKMGYTKKQMEMLEKMSRMSSGVVLITGPTGSGKTSTLFEMMAHQARTYPGLRQVTVENPVEYPMPWAVQLPVMGAKNDEESGSAFLNMVRMSLRMDPDIILFGEIRSGDEAVSAIQAAMTGHLVWSTLHVTDPFMSIDRLETMDRTRLHRQIICDHKLIRGLIAQRLVPVLCEKCKVPVDETNMDKLPDGVLENAYGWYDCFALRGEDGFTSSDGLTSGNGFASGNGSASNHGHESGGRGATFFLRGPGCTHCNGDAVTGARAVAEVVFTDASMMKDMIENGTDVARKNHRTKRESDYSMLGNAMMLACRGLFDLNDVERSIDIIVKPDQE